MDGLELVKESLALARHCWCLTVQRCHCLLLLLCSTEQVVRETILDPRPSGLREQLDSDSTSTFRSGKRVVVETLGGWCSLG